MTAPSIASTPNGTGFYALGGAGKGFKLTMTNPVSVNAFGLDLANLGSGTIRVTITGADSTTVTRDFSYNRTTTPPVPADLEITGNSPSYAFLGLITDQPFTEAIFEEIVSKAPVWGGTIRYGPQVSVPAPGASDPTPSQPQPQVGSAQGQLVGSTLALMPLVTSMIHVHLRGVAGPTGGACGGGSWPDVRKT